MASMKIQSSRIFKLRVKEIVVSLIASQLSTELCQPEDVIFHQYGDCTDFYLIARGECVVNIKDENNKVIKNFKILGNGDYFGEIGLVYGCKRTATVISRKYSTLAKLSKAKFA